MAYTRREKYIGAGVGAAVVLYVLNQLVLQPYSDSMSDLRKQRSDEDKRKADRVVLLSQKKKLEKTWTQIKADGLTDDESIAASQASGAVREWAHSTDVSIAATKAERSTESNGLPYEVISFQVTATGSTPSIARFLKAIETAKVPVRVLEMKLTPQPQREGTDDLKVEMTISTLCLKGETVAGGTNAS